MPNAHNNHQIHVYCQKIAVNSEPQTTNALTQTELSRLTKITSMKVRREFINGHTLLNTTLSKALDMAPADLRFERNSYGKPYLAADIFKKTNFFFSLSHSANLAVVAISKDIEIGIDVEDITKRKLLSCERLAQRFYSTREQQYMSLTENKNERIERFYKIWTLKEAYLKALGSGINIKLSTLNFTINDEDIFFTDTNKPQTRHYKFYLKNHGDYTIALASNTNTHSTIILH